MRNIKLLKLILLFSILFSVNLYSQVGKPPNREMSLARSIFIDNDYQRALKIYYELKEDFPDDALLNYRIAQCYFALYDDNKARGYLDIAIENKDESESDYEFYLLSGQVNHRLNMIDQALEDYLYFKKNAKDSRDTEVDKYIKQAKKARLLLADKKNVTVNNLGTHINSEFSDLYPVVSWNNSKLFFTTTRQVKKEQTINPVTKEYNESILVSLRNNDEKWLNPEEIKADFSVDSGFTLNSFAADHSLAYLSRIITEEEDGGDIYISDFYNNGFFGKPEKIEDTTINTGFYEFSANVNMLNNRIYYINDNPVKVKQNTGIVSSKKNNSGNWGTSRPVKVANSDYSESFVYVHPNEEFMIFSSNSDESMGGYDLFISVNKKGKWQKPVNFGYPINSTSNETGFSMAFDGKTAFIASDRDGENGKTNIYQVDLNDYFKENLDFSAKIYRVFGKIKDETETEIQANITIQTPSQKRYRIQTDNQGSFFLILTHGNIYNIKINSRGYERLKKQIDLTDYTGETEIFLNYGLKKQDRRWIFW